MICKYNKVKIKPLELVLIVQIVIKKTNFQKINKKTNRLLQTKVYYIIFDKILKNFKLCKKILNLNQSQTK